MANGTGRAPWHVPELGPQTAARLGVTRDWELGEVGKAGLVGIAALNPHYATLFSRRFAQPLFLSMDGVCGIQPATKSRSALATRNTLKVLI